MFYLPTVIILGFSVCVNVCNVSDLKLEGSPIEECNVLL